MLAYLLHFVALSGLTIVNFPFCEKATGYRCTQLTDSLQVIGHVPNIAEGSKDSIQGPDLRIVPLLKYRRKIPLVINDAGS